MPPTTTHESTANRDVFISFCNFVHAIINIMINYTKSLHQITYFMNALSFLTILHNQLIIYSFIKVKKGFVLYKLIMNNIFEYKFEL